MEEDFESGSRWKQKILGDYVGSRVRWKKSFHSKTLEAENVGRRRLWKQKTLEEAFRRFWTKILKYAEKKIWKKIRLK